MPVTYQSPGVYVEEVDKGAKPIEGAGTSLAAFIGITAEAGENKVRDDETDEIISEDSVLNKPVLITSWTRYQEVFGGFHGDAYLPDTVYGYFQNGGGSCYVISLRNLSEKGSNFSSFASADVPSGNKKSFTVSAKESGMAGNDLSFTISTQKSDAGDTFTLTFGDKSYPNLVMKKGDNSIASADIDGLIVSNIGSATSMPEDGTYDLSGGQVEPLTPTEIIGDVDARQGLGAFEAIDDIRLVSCPDAFLGYSGTAADKERIKIVHHALKDHCEKMRYRFAVLDAPKGLNAQDALAWYDYLEIDSSFAALYYPWIKIADLANGGSKLVPPSGHMVGIYNRVDAERGVHKAPANEVVRGAIDLEFRLTRAEQDHLNPKGVNCIRAFPGRGIRVWGARTLSSDGSWRYINVRRLFIFVEASMDQGLQWVVFEPNDSTLWAKVRRDVTAFLRNVWRSGALFGTTESLAFYVKCDEELNPKDVRDLGQLIIEVGMSPVKPAEFVIFRISQWAGANAEE